MNNTDLINKVIKRTNDTLKFSKSLFEEYLKDETTPLDDRWAVWCAAPSYMKNHESWYIVIDGVDGDDIVGINYDRYATYDVGNLIESLEEADEGSLNDFDVNKAKADILSRNIGSYCNDW